MTRVFINVGASVSRIMSGILQPETINDLSEQLSFEPAGSEYMTKAKKFKGNWDGRRRLFHKGHKTFGTGLLKRVIQILENHHHEVVLDNPELSFPLGDSRATSINEEYAARDYQTDVEGKAFLAHSGMIKVATGGGKTVIAAHLIADINLTPTIFFVHTKDLLYQAHSEFEKILGCKVGIIGDGHRDLDCWVTVCTLQTAARALDADYEVDPFAEGDESWRDKETSPEGVRTLLVNAKLIFVDECHRVAAPTATEVVQSCVNARWRYGLSASPWRDDGADLALEAVFGGVIADVPASYLIKIGALVRPIIRMQSVAARSFPKKTPYSEIYQDYIVNNGGRNLQIIENVESLLRRGVASLVLVRQIAHGSVLAGAITDITGHPVPFLSGKDDSTHRNSVLGDLRAGRLSCLVATTIADEGLDIKPLAGLVLAGGGKSSTRALQRVGRVLRPYPGKRRAEVIDFEDNARFLYQHSQARMKIYATEPEFAVVDF